MMTPLYGPQVISTRLVAEVAYTATWGSSSSGRCRRKSTMNRGSRCRWLALRWADRAVVTFGSA